MLFVHPPLSVQFLGLMKKVKPKVIKAKKSYTILTESETKSEETEKKKKKNPQGNSPAK